MNDHEIVEGRHGPEVICRATQDKPCHRRCSAGTCESWSDDSCACGPLIEVATCNAVDWIEGFGIEDCGPEDDPDVFDEDGIMHFRGPIEVSYDHDTGYTWRPAVLGERETSP